MANPINYEPDPVPEHGKIYGGGGFQGSPARKAIISLSNAQIRALPTTPVIIVPKTESLGYVGNPVRVPLVEQAVLHWKTYGGVAYANIDAGSLLSLFLGGDAGNGAQFPVDASSFLNNRGPFLGLAQLGFGMMQNDSLFTGAVFANSINLLDSVDDNAVSLAVVGNAGNFTNGHVGDILRVSLLYRIFNTATGEFE